MSEHYFNLPVTAQPTDVLANRFNTWRKIIRGLNVYLRELAAVQDDVVRQNIRLSHAINIPFMDYGTAESADLNAIANGKPPALSTAPRILDTDAANNSTLPSAPPGGGGVGPSSSIERDDVMFLGYGHESIGDVPGNLVYYHMTQANTASRTSKELTQHVIPRLEDLRRDLLVKLKEIKNLASDFRNSVAKEQAQTKQELQNYAHAVQTLQNSQELSNPKNDPYLLKVSLDRQITRQLNEENYLLEAFLNLEGSGRELERVVAQEVQQALDAFSLLLGEQATNVLNLLVDPLKKGFIAKDPSFEWDAFIKRDPNFVDTKLKPRKFSDIHYEFQNSPFAYGIKEGYLERRSKYLKSYSKAWYVLTPGFLHEFKSSDRRHDPHPVMSLSLDDCQLSHDKTKSSSGSSSHKFVLNAKSTHKGHNWVFRTENEESLHEWFSALEKVTSVKSITERASLYSPVKDAAVAPTDATTATNAVNHTKDTSEATETLGPSTAEVPAAVVAAKDTSGADPVESDSSEVTSNGEPFAPIAASGAGLEEDKGSVPDTDTPRTTEALLDDHVASHDEPVKPRGRFPSEVNLENSSKDAAIAGGEDDEDDELISPGVRPRKESAAQFLDASDLRKLTLDNSSVFSYDLKHPSSTLDQDEPFSPVDSDLPVNVERRLTMTKHKDEDDATAGIGVARHPEETDVPLKDALVRRRSSVASRRSSSGGLNKPTRRPTGSFGATQDDLKPLTTTSAIGSEETKLFFADGLPDTTGGQ